MIIICPINILVSWIGVQVLTSLKVLTANAMLPLLFDQSGIVHLSESSDDILAKYRKQPSASDTANQVKEKAELRDESDSDSTPAYDPNNLENCKAFLDAKKKLRMVLSTADFQVCQNIILYPSHFRVFIGHTSIYKVDISFI